MSNRYYNTFQNLKNKGEIAFIPFAVAGDPDIQTSEAILKTYIDAGADILEIGFPFSDPIADGPINQKAANRAIKNGISYYSFFKLITNIRKYSNCPIGVLLYSNSIYYIGYQNFCKHAAESGIDSLLVADMPPEESIELSKYMKQYDIKTVHIVSELTSPKRIKYICNKVTGFVYVVSRLGTTGIQKKLNTHVKLTLSNIRKITSLPLCVGFGISSPTHIEYIKEAGADGAIVGSAMVKIIEDNLSNKKRMLKLIYENIKKFKSATKI